MLWSCVTRSGVLAAIRRHPADQRCSSTVALLYIDLLGMKAEWHAGGIDAALRRYREFNAVVVQGLSALSEQVIVGGGVQSDAAALTFETARDAVVAGRGIFQSAFWSGWSGRRMWLRGVIFEHDWPPDAPLEKLHQLPHAPDGVFERIFKKPLLRAINLEQAGFRGQRLLIEGTLLTPELEQELAVMTSGRPLTLFRTLQNSPYPELVDGFQDVLWMLEADPAAWGSSQLHMLNLLRWSSAGGDAEVVHASATHVVFAQAEAIRFGALNAPAWRAGGPTDKHVRQLWHRLTLTLARVHEGIAKTG